PAGQHRQALRAALTRLDLPAPPPAAAPAPGGDLDLRGVEVGWPGDDRPVLRDLTLHVPAGTHVAVTGPSGAGKSTLLALLLGFLTPARGTASVPARVAWCPQDPMLVDSTVRENLLLADPLAGDDRLVDALRRAGLGHWAGRLDTHLSGGDLSVSGGEAQRLALARALLADADVLLLDEPTAHLDAATAAAVLDTIRAQRRTVVHVTHRAEEAAVADLVVEVDVAGHLRAVAVCAA
ncbi:hypothetical protein BLA60_27390, partial [Actinophytocola xinjiangensis]